MVCSVEPEPGPRRWPCSDGRAYESTGFRGLRGAVAGAWGSVVDPGGTAVSGRESQPDGRGFEAPGPAAGIRGGVRGLDRCRACLGVAAVGGWG